MNQILVKNEMILEVERVLKMEAQALLDCAERLGEPAFSSALLKALTALDACLTREGKIVVTGVGKSGKIGQKIAATLCSTGSASVFLHSAEGLHGDLGMVRPGDTVLALSYTGNTQEILSLLPSFKQLGVDVIGMGGKSDSRLARECDVWIDARISAEACPHNLAPTTSTTLMLALGDALAIALMKSRGFDSQSFAQNHPGGSLGKRLKLKVKDLMHGRNEVAALRPDASMEEVIVSSTQKKLGAVLVVENDLLLGIITDGDLRRSLQHREKFFQMKAREVMTQGPVTVSVEMFASHALELMENRASQISVLPVVDEKGVWQGLLRLHDIVKTF